MGLALCYVQAKAIQNRLDQVLGIENWRVSYKEIHGGFICRLGIRIDSEFAEKMEAIKKESEKQQQALTDGQRKVLSKGADLDNPVGALVTDEMVKNKFDNLKITGGAKLNKITSTDFEVSNSGDLISGEVSVNLKTEMKAKINSIDSKASRDGSNIDVDKFKAKLGITSDIISTGGCVDLDNLTEESKNKLKEDLGVNNLDSTYAKKSEVDSKANKNLDNISNKGKKIIKDIAKTEAITEVKSYLSKKADVDMNNISKEGEDKIEKIVSKKHYSKTEVDNKIDKLENTKLDKRIEEVEKSSNNRKKAIIENQKAISTNRDYILQKEVRIDQNTQRLAILEKRVDNLENKVDKSISLMSAMSSVEFSNLREGNIGIAAGVGQSGSSQAVAIGVAYSPNENFTVNAKVGGVSGRDVDVVFSAGMMYQFSVK